MEKAALLKQATETLSPFETEHIVQFLRGITVQSALSNPWIMVTFVVIAFYAVVVRSKFVLCALFTCISLLLLVHFTMPVASEGGGLALSTTLPFAFGGLAIGGFIIYLYFIKTE